MNETDKRLRISALLVMLGLGVELASLGWHHPTSFVVFVVLGGLLMSAGICTYLYAVLSQGA